MAKVRLFHGKPLTVGGKVALSDACCCTTTCNCPKDSLHVSASTRIIINDSRNCPACGSSDCSLSVDSIGSGSFDIANFCSSFGINQQIYAHNWIGSDGSGSCSAVGALTLSGSVLFSVGVQQAIDFGNPPCDGFVQLSSTWNLTGTSLLTNICGDACIGTFSHTYEEDTTITNFYNPSGIYHMDHTVTASGYSARLIITATIS